MLPVRLLLGPLLIVVSGLLPGSAFAQASTASLSGSISDPSGARIPRASIHLHSDSLDRDLFCSAEGLYAIVLPPGSYALTVDAPGFRTLIREAISLAPGERRDISLRLQIDALPEEISVDFASGASPAENQNALSFSGNALEMLSSDPQILQQQLVAMAGGGAGMLAPQFYIDGFSNGQLPPKAAIRSIRINSNPFSTVYDRPGFGRIEINTQAGGNRFHGDLDAGGTDVAFNSRNPYTSFQPPYHQLLFRGSLNGPLGKHSSFFLAGYANDLQNNTVVNAVDPSSTATLSAAVPNPQQVDALSLRLDHQFSPANQLNGRFGFNRTRITNGGVGLLVLPSEGYASDTVGESLELSDNQIISPRVVNDARVQYMRQRLSQNPNDTAPTILVEGAFNGGGSPFQALHENDTHLELQDNLAIERGRHYIRTGFRYRFYRDSSFSSAGFNGQFIFPSLAAFQAHSPSQFNLTTGQPTAAAATGDLSLYGEDDWKLTPNLTFSYGLRFETQTEVPDHVDPAPRAGLVWAVHPNAAHIPLLTLRGGVGVFYQRFEVANLLQTVRQNGTTQTTVFVRNPCFYPVLPPATTPNCSYNPNTAQPTIYRVDPDLRTSYDVVTSITAERMIGHIGSITANFVNGHGDHVYVSRNINAPLPGTYTPGIAASGTRPFGGTQNIYEFAAAGQTNGQIFFSNLNLNPMRRLMLFAFYVLQHNYADANSATAFASNSYNIKQDYGPEDAASAQQIFCGGTVSLPHGFSLDPFISARSGRPFNITTGTDLNGDTIYNDRPAFATDLSRPSVVRTAFGNFDTAPLPSQTLVPYNYGRAPGLVWVDLQARETLHVGPRPAAASTAAPAPATSARPAPRPERPWTLAFSIEAQNLFNHLSPGPPVGVLASPFFGRSLSTATDFSGLTAANRSFLLHTTFTF